MCLTGHNDSTRPRLVSRQVPGCFALSREQPTRKPSYIHLLYVNRAFEWVSLRQLFKDCLIDIHLDPYVPMLEDIVFAWSYRPTVSYNTYHPRVVCCNFNLAGLRDNMHPYIC